MMIQSHLIQTSRFGAVEIKEDDVLDFFEGILGFANLRKFVLLDDPHDEIFAWLQSCEQPDIAFPILEPELFIQNYQVTLTRHDVEAIKLAANERTRFFSIITIPSDPTLMTANMKAPIVINIDRKIARQCVLQDNGLAIKEPIFAKLQQRLVSNPKASIKSRASDWGVAVRLPDTQPIQQPAPLPEMKT